ncbi:WD40-repeat-containing domain protein [Geopyxis carbonaria]|nr:WD40-repeat-containing domain protein [Geopyxis carbonaria]
MPSFEEPSWSQTESPLFVDSSAQQDSTQSTIRSFSSSSTNFRMSTPEINPTRNELPETPSPSQVLSHMRLSYASPISRGSTPRNHNTPDRFIPSAASIQSFRMGSPADRLTPQERLLRRHGIDPTREPSSPERSNQGSGNRPRPNSPTSFRPGQVNRTITSGSIGVFGSTGPITSYPTTTSSQRGREVNGHIFADKESPEVEMEKHEMRLSAALGVDRAKKVFSFARESTGINSGKTGQGSPRVDIEREELWATVFHNQNQAPGQQLANQRRAYRRTVPTTPFRVLDAPGLRDDYYCSLLAYNPATHSLAVGLHSDVYSWDEKGGAKPFEAYSASHVTSLAFSSAEGHNNILAIGRIDGSLGLWSPEEQGPRVTKGHAAGLACIAWKPIVTPKPDHLRHPAYQSTWYTEDLLVGDEMGNVYLYAVEWNTSGRGLRESTMTLIRRLVVHTQQICGLAWSSDGEQFATGGNDNVAHLFDTCDILDGVGLGEDPDLRPVQGGERYRWPHGAAVKAIAFCPWQRSLLATGGGSNDRCIHFFHTFSGAPLATINVSAQVTSLLWSTSRREIAATFGYANPDHPVRIAVFSWPECRQVVQVPWQEDMRALYAVSYPGGPAISEGSRTTGEPDDEEEDDDDTRGLIGGPQRLSGAVGGISGATGATGITSSTGAQGKPKKARDTEGCIVVAASDETVRFHEVWSDTRRGVLSWKGVLGGSDILEQMEGIDNDGSDVIR